MTDEPLPESRRLIADVIAAEQDEVIDALKIEIVRLTEALEKISRLGVNMRADFSRSADQSRIAREALNGR